MISSIVHLWKKNKALIESPGKVKAWYWSHQRFNKGSVIFPVQGNGCQELPFLTSEYYHGFILPSIADTLLRLFRTIRGHTGFFLCRLYSVEVEIAFYPARNRMPGTDLFGTWVLENALS